MKRLLNIIVYIIVLLIAHPLFLQAGQRFDKHGLRTNATAGYIHNLYGVYLDASYSNIFHSVPNANTKNFGYGVGGGFCYEHQRGVAKLQVGIGFRYRTASYSVNDTTFSVDGLTDSRGSKYTMQYDFYDRIDKMASFQVQLPILLGMEVRHFYCLGGLKLNLDVAGSTFVRTTGTTTGYYPQFFGMMAEMDNHGLRKDVQVEYKGSKINFKPDVMLSFEAGYEWSQDRLLRSARNKAEHGEYRFRVAAFVEYGLVNINPKSDKSLVYIPSDYRWDFSEYQFNHVLTTDVANSSKMHNFFAGIKLTMLIGSYSYRRCVICSGWNSDQKKSKYNGIKQ